MHQMLSRQPLVSLQFRFNYNTRYNTIMRGVIMQIMRGISTVQKNGCKRSKKLLGVNTPQIRVSASESLLPSLGSQTDRKV